MLTGVPARICHVFEIFRVKILTVHLLTLAGLTPGPQVTKSGDDLLPRRSTILQNFSTIAQTVYDICVTKVFHFLAPGGLTPGAKFTKRGDDLADTELYHPPKFHRPTSTHAGDIRYQKSCGHTHTQTKKQIYPQHAYRHVWIINAILQKNNLKLTKTA